MRGDVLWHSKAKYPPRLIAGTDTRTRRRMSAADRAGMRAG